jgi:uncharacterized protein YegL
MSMQFQAEVFQNQFLPEGAREVHAIMTVTASGTASGTAEGAVSSPGGSRLFGIICDVSGSMQGAKIQAVKQAMVAAIDLLPEDAYFFIVTGSHEVRILMPPTLATASNKAQAGMMIRTIQAAGATVISRWLETALKQFQQMPGAMRQALLLTDGQNDGSDTERLTQMLQACEGQFQCDCRGVGTDWNVKQLQQIGSKLLGTTDIIPTPDLMVTDFQTILSKAMGKAISDVALRLWTPQGATIRFCKEVSPEIVDLTDRAKSVKAQTVDYPTGAWGGQESRDFHFCIDVPAGNVGDEMLAGRASLITSVAGVETKIAEARILALWTDDEGRSTKIDRRVAHYTGQAELATTIQEGLDARLRGDEEVATAKLGKAVKIAHDSGNEATAKLLRAVVEVDDAPTGTVRLKRSIAKEDEMALETRSTKTTRIAKS